MGYDKETEEHLKEVQDIRNKHFIPKRIKKALKRQDKSLATTISGIKGIAEPVAFKNTVNQLLTDMLSIRAAKTAELILHAYSIMGSKLILDCALNKDLREYIGLTLSDEVAVSLDHLQDSLERHAKIMKHENLGSYLNMLIEQIGHCRNDMAHLMQDMKNDSWNATAAVDTAKRNFKSAVGNMKSALQPFDDIIKRNAMFNAKEAQSLFA